MDVYAGRLLYVYGDLVGIFGIGRYHFLIKRICCLEVIVQARTIVGTGLFY